MATPQALLEVIRDIDSFDRLNTIYTAQPWTPQSAAIVAMEPEDGGLPSEAVELGFNYFLEVFIALEVLQDFQDWMASTTQIPSLSEKCARLITYAETDA